MGVASARGGGGGGSVERKLNMPHSISHSTIGGLRINAGRWAIVLFSSEISARPSPRVLSLCVKRFSLIPSQKWTDIGMVAASNAWFDGCSFIFFFPPFFAFFSLASSSPFPVCSRGKRRGVCVRVSREFPAKGRGSMGLCEFFPGLSFLSSQFFPPFFGFAINGERCAAAIHSREVTRGREREVNLAGR